MWTDNDICEAMGYESHSALAQVLSGERIPAHDRGEALWAFYLDTFLEKPPMSKAQQVGLVPGDEMRSQLEHNKKS